MNIFSLCLLLITYQLVALFEYDRAVDTAQKNRWQDAVSIFKQLVAEKPDNAELLYDTGVAAFNNEDYQQAKAYFQSAVQQDNISKQLKAQAYFNKGNAHVKLQELKEALLSYEQALMVQPENERAKHNHQTVKKMLEQQERQQQEQKEQKQSKQQNQPEQQQEKQKQDQQSEQPQKQDEQPSCNNNNNQSSQKTGGSKESGSDEQEEQSDQESSQHDGLDKEGDKQNEQQDGPDEKEDQSDQHDDRDESNISNQSSQEHEQDKQQEQDGHTNPQEQQDGQQEVPQQHMQPSQKEQDAADGQQGQEASLDPRLQQVLEKRGQRDAQLNKQVIRASVRQEMKGEHGQNCW